MNFVQALAVMPACRPVCSTSCSATVRAPARLSLSHPDVQVVSFTGSTEVGRIVNQACAPSFKKVHLEMGGKNVILVMEDAKLDLAVEGALWGGFGTGGSDAPRRAAWSYTRRCTRRSSRRSRRARRRCASATG